MTSRSEGRVVALGECMVELARGSDGRFGLAYGGDTFNTSVYLARAGVPVAYATALGDDPYSAGILALARSEGIATDLVRICPGRMPGLYLIETSPAGERTFHYWRDRSPAREVLDDETPETSALVEAIAGARLVYLSGITLSLYAPRALDRLALALARTRAAGGRVAMDGNYRPRGWGGDITRARDVLGRFWRLADIALPTFDDEQALWSDTAPEATVERLAAFGVGEIVVKLGAEGALVTGGDGPAVRVGVPLRVTPVDTTAAGDSFNAAYLARRLAGAPPAEAALAGHRLAGVVIAHRGAIAPRDATVAALA
jgi:2-dehydro-3-deoxygluconokinase